MGAKQELDLAVEREATGARDVYAGQRMDLEQAVSQDCRNVPGQCWCCMTLKGTAMQKLRR